VEFTTWWIHAVDLLKYDVIRVQSGKLDFINDLREEQGLERFEYFRILKKRRQPDLKVAITAQAYSVNFYDSIESEEAPVIIPSGPVINPGGGFGTLPIDIGFTSYGMDALDRIKFKLELGAT